MANKSSLNDYSALNSIFRDTAIGIVLSAGGLATLLPNLIEGYSEIKSLSTFDALNSFSVIYFLFPILLCTCYWLFRGQQLYLLEKLNDEERYFLAHAKRVKDRFRQLEFRTYVVTFFKTLPLFIFLFNPEFYAFSCSWLLLGLWYISVAWYEAYLAYQANENFLRPYLENAAESLPIGKGRYFSMLNHGFTIHALIFSLDLFLGLALIIFSAPWVVYSEWFYSLFATFTCFYAGSYLATISRREDLKFTDLRTRIASVVFIFFLIATSVPAVNLHNMTIIVICCAIALSALLLISFAFSKENGPLLKTRKTFIGFVIGTMLFGGLFSGFVVQSAFEKINREYFSKRLETVEALTNTELYPLFLLDTALSDGNAVNFIRRVHLSNQNNLFDIFSRNSFVNPPDSIATFLPHLKKYNVRSVMFRKYLDLNPKGSDSTLDRGAILKLYGGQDALNSFYQRHNQYVEDTIKGFFEKNASEKKLYGMMGFLSDYNHPLNFFSARFKRFGKQKDQARRMFELVTNLHELQLLIINAQEKKYRPYGRLGNPLEVSTDSSTFFAFYYYRQKLFDTLQTSYASIPELVPLSKKLSLKEIDATSTLVNFHARFLYYKEQLYAREFKNAQIIYRSYLNDSQRIGVYFFLVAMTVIAVAAYNNKVDNKRFFLPVELKEKCGTENPDRGCFKDKVENYPLPADMPAEALFIQALVLFVLVIPLLRPIKANNIDPEKPYWMVSIENWYAPTFSTHILSPEVMPEPAISTNSDTPADLSQVVSKLEEIQSTVKEKLDDLNTSVKTQNTSPK
jgi:hypothetical protein